MSNDNPMTPPAGVESAREYAYRLMRFPCFTHQDFEKWTESRDRAMKLEGIKMGLEWAAKFNDEIILKGIGLLEKSGVSLDPLYRTLAVVYRSTAPSRVLAEAENLKPK